MTSSPGKKIKTHLADDDFIQVIDATPLVAIDLIVQNEMGEILLGRRCNRPAQNYWFVPGGRIRKNERSQDALQRIGRSELQIDVPTGRLLGVFDHFYEDNYFGLPDMSTHYVTLAYRVEMKKDSLFMHDEQHVEMKWWDPDSLMSSLDVHDNTKLYFSKSLDNGFRCNCD
ncbi:MAG: GDP-mannose mannosyl hydrolase [Burkholderiaceae bacterium]